MKGFIYSNTVCNTLLALATVVCVYVCVSVGGDFTPLLSFRSHPALTFLCRDWVSSCYRLFWC